MEISGSRLISETFSFNCVQGAKKDEVGCGKEGKDKIRRSTLWNKKECKRSALMRYESVEFFR